MRKCVNKIKILSLEIRPVSIPVNKYKKMKIDMNQSKNKKENLSLNDFFNK